MKLVLFLSLLTSLCFGFSEIELSKSILNTSKMEFLEHIDEQVPMRNALALNVEYDQISQVRDEIKKVIKRKITFFKGWDKDGEAHVTVITPVEYSQALMSKVSMKEINSIAKNNQIQNSDLKILGMGSGEKIAQGKKQETFFIIVDSMNLRKIRHLVYDLFVKRGGDPSAFDPTWFFPHITIGFTKTDLHENSGIFKNLKHSYDKRFKLSLK